MFLVLIGSLVVLATVPNPGHPLSDIEGGDTICTTVNGLCSSGGGDSYWTQESDGIYYGDGNVKVRNGNNIEIIGSSEDLGLIFSDMPTNEKWKLEQNPPGNGLYFKYYRDSSWETSMILVPYNNQISLGSTGNNADVNVQGDIEVNGKFEPDVTVEFFELEASPGTECTILGDGDWTYCFLSDMDFSEYGDHSRAGCNVRLQGVGYPGSVSYHGSRGSWELCSAAETHVECGATCVKFE